MKLHWPNLKMRMKTDWMFYSQLALRITFLCKPPEARDKHIFRSVVYYEFYS